MRCGPKPTRLVEPIALCLLVIYCIAEPSFGQQPPLAGNNVIPEPLPPPSTAVESGPPVVEVRIIGNETVSEDKVLSHLRTRVDRVYDPELLQGDKRRLASSGLFSDVRIFTQQTPQGIVVTFEVIERPTIRYIQFIGNRGISDRTLLKQAGLKVGDALNFYGIEEGRRKIEDYYHTKGFPKAEVFIEEGNSPEHRGAVFNIAEGPLQRVGKVEFIGNEWVSGDRLMAGAKLESKPGILYYLFRGKVDADKIATDQERLTAYYRSFGFFKAEIAAEKEYDEANKWLTLRWIINEGPRFVVRDVSVAGNEIYGANDLQQMLKLTSGNYFDQGKMEADVNDLRDLYGGNGYIFADVKAEPRFSFEQPGELDLVYNITEGEQFRVGRINVHIAGEFPHTRESVVLDRLSVRPGDIVDIREVRASERRLKSSQLFENDPAGGKAPRVVIRPPQLDDLEQIADRPTTGSVRGQSPDDAERPLGPDEIELDVYVESLP